MQKLSKNGTENGPPKKCGQSGPRAPTDRLATATGAGPNLGEGPCRDFEEPRLFFYM